MMNMVFIKHALKSYPTNVIFLSVKIYVNDFISAVGTQSKCSEVRYQSKKPKIIFVFEVDIFWVSRFNPVYFIDYKSP